MRLLDLFCGAGGCAVGYHRAGFTEIVGVDIKPQPRYPFTFIQADALEYVAAHGHEFDCIHASPPCQAYTPLRALQGGKTYPDLVAATRAALIETGRPYVIENVMSAPLQGGIVLCGGMFGLRTYRHRRFESSVLLWQPLHPRHRVRAFTHDKRRAHYGKIDQDSGFVQVTGGGNCSVANACAAMGIDWMNKNELNQAIPPPYTDWIGHQLLAYLNYP